MNLVEHGDVIIGFRPEHFFPVAHVAGRETVPADLRKPGIEAPYVPLRFRVSHEEYLGAERILYGTLEESRFESKKVISRMPSTHGARFEVGSVYPFAVPERHLKFFDRARGTRTAPVDLDVPAATP
jgi:hypothetical protein